MGALKSKESNWSRLIMYFIFKNAKSEITRKHRNDKFLKTTSQRNGFNNWRLQIESRGTQLREQCWNVNWIHRLAHYVRAWSSCENRITTAWLRHKFCLLMALTAAEFITKSPDHLHYSRNCCQASCCR